MLFLPFANVFLLQIFPCGSICKKPSLCFCRVELWQLMMKKLGSFSNIPQSSVFCLLDMLAIS